MDGRANRIDPVPGSLRCHFGAVSAAGACY